MDQRATPICSKLISPLNSFVASPVEGADSLVSNDSWSSLNDIDNVLRFMEATIVRLNSFNSNIRQSTIPAAAGIQKRFSIPRCCPFNFADSAQCSVSTGSRGQSEPSANLFECIYYSNDTVHSQG